MSERPFMQLYVSDFLGDTLDLSTEGIGAYMLMLMAMWNAGGDLPDDEVKLARITRMSVKKWRGVAKDILDFFERDNGRITHQRLMKELQKSEGKTQSRASAGAEGGRSKALKDKERRLANATDLPWHLPDTRSQKDIEPQAQRSSAAPRPKYDELLDMLLDALGISQDRAVRHPGLMNLQPIYGLIDAKYDLERDILDTIRGRRKADIGSWSYYDPIIRDAVEKRRGIAAQTKPAPVVEDWRKRLAYFISDGVWGSWGPKPGENGCKAPPELIAELRLGSPIEGRAA